MKKEFMLYIRNRGDAKAALNGEEHTAFLRSCEQYIQLLKEEGLLIAAQPVDRKGLIISREDDNWKLSDPDASADIQVGYYHILAKDMEEAIAIAKRNPEFQYVPSASVEVKPIKMKEEKTDYVYPTQRAHLL